MNTQSTPSVTGFNIDAFISLYQTFNRDTLSQLKQLYSDDIIFKDPLHQIAGIDALTNYFANFCNPETQCRFEFSNHILNKDQAFLQWTMHYSHPQLKQGKPLTLNGGTLIKFNSHIYYHEDFYDMGAMIYKHLPILGWVIEKINSRIIFSNNGEHA